MKTPKEIAKNLQLQATAFGIEAITVENILLAFSNALAEELMKEKKWQSSNDMIEAAKKVIGITTIEELEKA